MANVGFATLTVIPSARGFRDRLQREVGGDIDSVGRRAGRRLGEAITEATNVNVDADVDIDRRGGIRRFLRGVRTLASGVASAVRGIGTALSKVGGVASSVFRSFQGPVANIVKLIAVGVVAQLTIATGAMGLFQAAGAAAFGAFQAGAVGAVGTLAAIGIAAAAQSKKVKSEFKDLGEDLKSGLQDAAQPFVGVLLDIADRTRQVFADLKPALSGVFKDLAPVVGDFFDRFADSLDPVIKQLRPFVRDLLPSFEAAGRALGPIMSGVADFMGRIGDAIRDTSPQFEQFLRNLSGLFDPLGRLASSLIRIGARVLPGVTDKLVKVTDAVAGFADRMDEFLVKAKPGKLFDALAKSVGNFVTAFVQGLTGGEFQGGKRILDSLARGIRELTAFLNKPETQAAIKRFARQFGNFIRDLPKHIASVKRFLNDLKAVWSTIKFVFTNPLQTAGILIGVAINGIKVKVLSGIRGLLTNIIETLRPLPGNLERPFVTARRGVNQAINGINADTRRKLNTLTGTVGRNTSQIPGKFASGWEHAKIVSMQGTAQTHGVTSRGTRRIAGAVNPVRNRLPRPFSRGWNLSAAETRRGVNRAAGITGTMPGRARGALAGIGGALVGAGIDLIGGLISGIRSMASRVASAARNVVENAVAAARAALDIGSPSKVFRDIGRQTGDGLVEGMLASRRQVAMAGARLASSAAMGAASPATADGLGPAIGNLSVMVPSGASAEDVIDEALHRARVVRRGGL